MTSETKHLDVVRKRFTETAETFYAFTGSKHGAEAGHLRAADVGKRA